MADPTTGAERIWHDARAEDLREVTAWDADAAQDRYERKFSQ